MPLGDFKRSNTGPVFGHLVLISIQRGLGGNLGIGDYT